MRVALVILMIAGSAKAEDRPLFQWRTPGTHESIVLGVATALIWVDVLQTLDWNRKAQFSAETNPFLGAHPSASKIVLVGGVLPSVLLAMLWLAMPSEWRMLPCGAVIGAETGAIIVNSANGLSVRF